MMSPLNRSLKCPQYDKLLPKSKSKSAVWQHYGQPADATGSIVTREVAICNHCKFPVSCKGSTTSNLMAHLKKHHPMTFHMFMNSMTQSPVLTIIKVGAGGDRNKPIINDQPQSSTPSSTPHSTVGQRSIKRLHTKFELLDASSKDQISHMITKLLVSTLQPYRVVETAEFREMVTTLNPHYVLPDRKYFSAIAVPRMYDECMEKFKADVSAHKRFGAISTECWSSLCGTNYLSLTFHFVSEDWELKSICLSCRSLEENHIAEDVQALISEILQDWGISLEDVVSCTTDNTPLMEKAIALLGVKHIPCFGHSIRLAVEIALKIPTLNEGVTQLRRLQAAIAHSADMKQNLEKVQEQLKVEQVSLPNICTTQWYSITKLCRLFVQNRVPISRMLQDHPEETGLMPNGMVISAIQHLITATALLQDVTTTVSGENYVSNSCILPLYRQIKRSLTVKMEDNFLLKRIKEKILMPLKERYEALTMLQLLQLSTFFDPRFRVKFFDEGEKDVVQNAALKLIEEQASSTDSNLSVETEPEPKKAKKGLAKLLERNSEETPPHVNPEQRARTEVETYLAMPFVQLDHDPLLWWKNNAASFPLIASLARKYLVLQGTCVPSEQVFSTTGNLINTRKAVLMPKQAEIQVFLAQNRKYIP